MTAHSDDDDDDDPHPRDRGARAGTIRYINTDLEVRAAADVDLTPLVEALESAGVFPLPPTELQRGTDGWYVAFETEAEFDEPAPNIARMLDAVEALDPAARALWRSCTLRHFDVGYAGGDRPRRFTNDLPVELLWRMADAGASLRVTLYPRAVDP